MINLDNHNYNNDYKNSITYEDDPTNNLQE